MKYRTIEKKILIHIVIDLARKKLFPNLSEPELYNIIKRKYRSIGRDQPMEYLYNNERYSLWRCHIPGYGGYRVYDKCSRRSIIYYVIATRKIIYRMPGNNKEVNLYYE